MSTFQDRHRSDFNNSAGSFGSFGDILWRDAAGDTVIWLMTNNQLIGQFSSATLPFVPPDWHVKAAAEFDVPAVDSADDILWQNDNGALALWRMSGTTVSAIHALGNPGPAWHVVGDNDFNGDRADDILFRHDDGSLAIWGFTTSNTETPSRISSCTENPGPSWHVVGTGDSSGDDRAGILWQNDNGALVLWENPTFVDLPGPGPFILSFVTFASFGLLPTVDPSWHVKGMQDINGDFRADIVFQNDNGAVVIWEMGGADGTTINAVNLINLNPGPSWHIVGMRDMDDDDHIDILFQNDNGVAAVWEDYTPIGSGMATVLALPITPNPNPNGHVWDLL